MTPARLVLHAPPPTEALTLDLARALTAGRPGRVPGALHATLPFAATAHGEPAPHAGVAPPRGTGSVTGSDPLPVVRSRHRVPGADGLGGAGGGRAVEERSPAHEGLLTPALEPA